MLWQFPLTLLLLLAIQLSQLPGKTNNILFKQLSIRRFFGVESFYTGDFLVYSLTDLAAFLFIHLQLE